MGRVMPAGAHQPARQHGPALPTLAPCGCKADPSHSGVRQLPAPPLHTPLPWAARLRYPLRSNGPGRATTGSLAQQFPRPNFPAELQEQMPEGGLARLRLHAFPKRYHRTFAGGGDDECSLIKQNATPGGEHGGDGITPAVGCAKNLPGWGGQGSLLQRGWGSSCSGDGAHPTAMSAPGSSASEDINQGTLTEQKVPQGLAKPV